MLGLSRRFWFMAVPLGFAVIASAVLLAASFLRTPAPPLDRATASPEPSDASPSQSPTAPPTPAPAATLELEWTEAAAFAAEGEGFEEVSDAASWAHGIVAVGTRYAAPIPKSGRLPTHGGRVWLSADGRAWEDATPPAVFDGMVLLEVFQAADGSLIVIGEHGAFEDPWAHFWRSIDGRVWDEMRTDLDLPPKFIVRGIERGPLGFLLLGFAPGVGYELWFSADGLAWELVWTEPNEGESRERVHVISAGERGFAAFGASDLHMTTSAFTLASADGRDWALDPNPPLAGGYLAAVRGGWIAIGSTDVVTGGPYREPAEPSVWTSADGFEWRQIATLVIEPVELEGQPACYAESQDQATAGGWLVMSRDFYCSYGDDEAQVSGHDIPRISIDGITWQPLPFARFSFDPAAREAIDEGSTVRVAVATEGGLVLAGESNGQVTFWLGKPR